MSLSYAPDPRWWIEVPAYPAPGWARAEAERIAAAQDVDDAQLISRLERLATEAADHEPGDEDARWMCVTDLHLGAMVLDLDWIDLGGDAPDEVEVDESAAEQTEEFTAGQTHGKRIVWVTPADADSMPASGADNDALQGQVLYVARVKGTGLLVTMRSNLHSLDLIVASVDACENMLETMAG